MDHGDVRIRHGEVKNEECRTVLLIVYAVFKSLAFWDPHITRKLSYRKDGCAMRLGPIYGALKIFESP